MANRNTKAKGTTLVDKKLAKAKTKIAQLEEQLRASQFQMLNIRQMYEGVVGEKQALQNQVARANQMLVAATVQARGKTIKLKGSTLAKLNEFVGVDTKAVDEDLVLTAITRADFDAMQDDLDEAEDNA